MAYVPMGAYVSDSTTYPALWNAIRRDSNAAFLKLEPGYFPKGDAPDLNGFGIHKKPAIDSAGLNHHHRH